MRIPKDVLAPKPVLTDERLGSAVDSDTILNKIEELKGLGYTNIWFDIDYIFEYEEMTTFIVANGLRTETPAEVNQRVKAWIEFEKERRANKKASKRATEIQEREMYEKLKAKFESGSKV